MTNKEKADKLIIHSANPQMATFEELVNISESIKEVVKGIETIETIIHNNPWTGGASNGAFQSIRLRTDTTDRMLAANWTATWADATHASRKGRATLNVYDTAIREAIRMEASGSAAMLGFYGTTAVVQAANTVAINDVLVNVGLRASGGVSNFSTNIDISTKDIVTDTTTGTKIGTGTTQKLGFFNATPVVRPTALTTQLTTITATAPGTPDYAIQDLVNAGGYGFVTADEGQSFLKVVLNLQTRVAELETKLQALGLVA